MTDAAPAPSTGRLRASVIVPCRNEAGAIGACVESLYDAGLPPDAFEILLVDGMSDDGTRTILEGLRRRYPSLRVLDNPWRVTPVALNLGIAAARGEAVLIAGAHAQYPPGYVARLLEWLDRSGADAVGGVCETVPGGPSPIAAAIAVVLTHPFGVGNAHFRTGVTTPREVDTVPFGCYRRSVFERFGVFDEELVRNQDDEFNFRLVRGGARLLLVPDVRVRYEARDSLRKLWRMAWQYGYFKPLVAAKVGRVMTARQLAPAAFTLALAAAAVVGLAGWSWAPLAAVAGGYGVALVDAAAGVLRRRDWRVAAAAVPTFPVLHIGYGLGFLAGAAVLPARASRRGAHPADVPLSR